VRATAAEMLVQRLTDLGIIGLGVLLKQRRRGDHQSCRAVTALGRTLVNKGLLQSAGPAVLGQPFHGRDLRAYKF